MQWSYPPGTVLLDKYRVESVIGRGGMAIVLRATHLQLGEEVALKILSPTVATPDVIARFLREAQALVRLRGEHVARVFDVGRLPDGAPYTVMEYLRGVDLAGELSRCGALAPGLAVDYVLQACEALAEAHARGVVHRDIKPSNLFLTARPDGTPLIKVLDFGISKTPAGTAPLTQTDMVMGTPGYMSPEQMKAARDVDARSDIWSLGIVLYECLSGRSPFQAEAFSAVVLKAATEPPPPLDLRLPRGLQDVVLRCLEKDRAARFASMAALAAALAPFAGDPRAAALVVDRTRLMLGGPPAAPPAPADRSDTATTLQGSAQVRTATRRFRYTLAGVVSLASVIGIVIAAVMSSPRGGAGAPGPASTLAPPPVASAVPPADAGDGRTAARSIDAAVDAAVDAAAASPSTASGEPGGTPAAPTGAPDPGATVQRCAELQVNQKWQELRDCAGELASLGPRDRSVQPRAEQFRQKAVKETVAALAAAKIKDAIDAGNLREAQKQLRAIGSDSVYLGEAGEAVRAAEARAIDDNRRKAQALLAKNDCAAIKRPQAQVNATTTPAVSGAVAAVAARCVDRTVSPPTEPAAAVAQARPPAAPGAPGAPAAPQTPVCEIGDVDDAMSQAANQFLAGFYKSALTLVVKALACKQTERMYRAAVTYACAAHDVAAAKLYYGRVSPQFQPPLVQRCQQENITIP
jgi:serine/threonine-protein kinase